MSYYSNAGWGGYGMHGAAQNASFYGVQHRSSYATAPFPGGSMRNMGSFYTDMQRKNSFYADAAQLTPPTQTPPGVAAAAAASTGPGLTPTPTTMAPCTMDTSSTFGSMAYYHENSFMQNVETPTAPVEAPAEATTPRDSPPPLLRKNSSGRILRRKVSFSGVPQTLPPEVEPRCPPQTPKRRGSRRLSAAPPTAEGEVGNVMEEPPVVESQQQLSPPQQQQQQALLRNEQRMMQSPPSHHFQQPRHSPQYVRSAQPPPHLQQGYYPPQQQGGPQPLNDQDAYVEPGAEYQEQAQSEEPQPTLAANAAVMHDTRGSLSRRNSTVFPYQGGRPPIGYAPCMQNYAMMPYAHPVYRPNFNPYRSAPYGMYNTNGTLYQRPPMTSYF